MIDWIFKNYVEIIAVISGLLYINFSIRQNILLWPLGLLSSLFLIIVNYHSIVYANMMLQGYYVMMSFYGWYLWTIGSKNKDGSDKQLLVKNMPATTAIIVTFAALCIEFVIYYLLKQTKSENIVLDSVTTTLGIIATWMLARKYVENWLLWIVTDIVSVGLYINMGLYLTTILYASYTILAVVGYLEWRKDIRIAAA